VANDFSGDANCVALYRMENGALTTDSKGSNTLTDVNSVTSDTTNYKEGSGSAEFTKANNEYMYRTDTNLDTGFPLKNGDTAKVISLCYWIRAKAAANFTTYNTLGKGTTNKLSLRIRLYGTGTNVARLDVLCGYNSGNSEETISHGSTLTCNAATWYHVGLVVDGVNKTIFIRISDNAGAKVGTNIDTSITNEINVEDGEWCIGTSYGSTASSDALLDEVVVFKDKLSESEIASIAAGTYGAASGYTLTAAQGSLTLSGQAAGLLKGSSIPVSNGSFSFTGQAAGFLRGSKLTAAQGSFVLTGEAAGLLRSCKISSAFGSFVLTGQAVGLTAARKLSVDYGAFSFSGQSATLTKSAVNTLTALCGTFALSGQAVGLMGGWKISASYGSFVLTGQAVTLSKASGARILIAKTGRFYFTGWRVGLIYSGIPAVITFLPAYWSGGYFGIDSPQMVKMMRSAQLLTDQTGFRVKCRLVDHDRMTVRKPGIVEFRKHDNALLSVNRKARLISYEIQFPEDDCEANILELSSSHFPIAER
jgi:hypothetical protein